MRRQPLRRGCSTGLAEQCVSQLHSQHITHRAEINAAFVGASTHLFQQLAWWFELLSVPES